MKAVYTRRSIRSYSEGEVGREKIERLLRAAMAAPSAGNQQPWHFIVITDGDILAEIPTHHPYASMAAEAAVAILVCGEPALQKHEGFWVQDCSAATQNILIAAEDEGLGAVWCGVYPVEERVTAFRRLLSVPEGVIPFALIPIGHPDESKPPADRYREERVHWNRYGG